MTTSPASVNTEVVLNMQRKLYTWSRSNPQKVFDDLFNLVCDARFLEDAWRQLCRNQGSRTPGIDGVTRHRIERQLGGVQGFLEQLRQDLRAGIYQPLPVRQRLIPKPGKPGKYRALGIPILKDRLVQMALKNVLEPIFEADFYPTSCGFRRGRSTHDALAILQRQMNPNKAGPSKFRFVIEGDIKACFDNVDHHLLMQAVRKRIGEPKVLGLILGFLKAGIMTELGLRHPVAGTPQGGIISPLLANVYLTALDERYRRWTPGPNEPTYRSFARRNWDRKHGRPCFYIVRYADDFVLLVEGSHEDAIREKEALALFLGETLRMELSSEKTLITAVQEGFHFLGYRLIVEPSLATGTPICKQRVPKDKVQQIRARLKKLTSRATTGHSLENLLAQVNPIIRGWRNYYKYATGASKLFDELDDWMWQRLRLWLNKKHERATAWELRKRFARRVGARWIWAEGEQRLARFVDGGTCHYRVRGTKISNGWNDELDQVSPYGEAYKGISGFTLTGELL